MTQKLNFVAQHPLSMLSESGEREVDEECLGLIPEQVAGLRATFASGKTRTIEWRLEQLKKLQAMLAYGRNVLFEALQKDLGRDFHSSAVCEVGVIEVEIRYLISNMNRLVGGDKVSVSLVNQPAQARLMPEPLGTILIMSAWNFPVQTLLQPLAGAIAAGNCAVLKPASLAGHTSLVLAKLVREHLDLSAIVCVEGGVSSGSVLLEQKFDKIIYTGGAAVGRLVLGAAAKHLTPVALELGGKNPCIVASSCAMVEVAARRICWAKFACNAGQVCLAPDYVLVHESVAPQLVDSFKKNIQSFFEGKPKDCPEFCRIINLHHANRLGRIITADKAFLVAGGHVEGKFVEPTILDFKKDKAAFAKSACMQQEIFGPVLPILTYTNIDFCIHWINQQEKPLATYLFGSEKDAKLVAGATSSGSFTLNDCIMQKAELGLPFGGVGGSGTGRYNGKYTFETFSHYKPVLMKSLKGDLDARYPPYTAEKKRIFTIVQQTLLGEKSIFSLGYNVFKYNMNQSYQPGK